MGHGHVWVYVAQLLCKDDTHTGGSRGPSAREKRTVGRRKSLKHTGSVHKLLSLLHSSKLIFQAFKNHANFCVDTRNQEQPILLGIGRKAIVDLK